MTAFWRLSFRDNRPVFTRCQTNQIDTHLIVFYHQVMDESQWESTLPRMAKSHPHAASIATEMKNLGMTFSVLVSIPAVVFTAEKWRDGLNDLPSNFGAVVNTLIASGEDLDRAYLWATICLSNGYTPDETTVLAKSGFDFIKVLEHLRSGIPLQVVQELMANEIDSSMIKSLIS